MALPDAAAVRGCAAWTVVRSARLAGQGPLELRGITPFGNDLRTAYAGGTAFLMEPAAGAADPAGGSCIDHRFHQGDHAFGQGAGIACEVLAAGIRARGGDAVDFGRLCVTSERQQRRRDRASFGQIGDPPCLEAPCYDT